MFFLNSICWSLNRTTLTENADSPGGMELSSRAIPTLIKMLLVTETSLQILTQSVLMPSQTHSVCPARPKQLLTPSLGYGTLKPCLKMEGPSRLQIIVNSSMYVSFISIFILVIVISYLTLSLLFQSCVLAHRILRATSIPRNDFNKLIG